MAEAKGSSSSSAGSGGGGGGGVGAARGDFVGGVPSHGFQALLASVGAPVAGAPNVHLHHQYNPAGLIHPAAPVPMPAAPVPPSSPYAPQLTVRTPPPPQQQQHCAQSNNLPPGRYQYWSGTQNDVALAPQQVPRSFADWTVYNSAFVSVACGSSSSSSNNNGYQQSLRPCSTTTWPNYMLRTPCYSNYPPLVQDHQAPSYHTNNHEDDSGFVSSFRVDPPLAPAPLFPPLSPASNNGSSAQFFNETTYTPKVKSEAMYTQKVKNSEDPPDMESENSDELDQTPVVDLPNLNQDHESLTARFNCRQYHIVVRKDLTNSDVGNIGRIVMPKRDAEANLPALLERDGMMLKMDDFKLPATWNFKYRFWPNNKSRMYILESTGEFVKSHGLEAGDILIIYKSSEYGKFLVRGEKATQQSAPLLCPGCKEEGNSSEECGFSMSLHAKRT